MDLILFLFLEYKAKSPSFKDKGMEVPRFLLKRAFPVLGHACVHAVACYVRLFATLWTIACQAPLSMGNFQEYRSGLPCPPPGDLPNQGIKPLAIMFPTLAGSFFATSTTWDALGHIKLDDDDVVSLSIFITSLATRELR